MQATQELIEEVDSEGDESKGINTLGNEDQKEGNYIQVRLVEDKESLRPSIMRKKEIRQTFKDEHELQQRSYLKTKEF